MATGTATVRDQHPQRREWQLPEGLNAAQMQEVQKAVLRLAEEQRLRQWCVEKALQMSLADPMRLTRDIFDFVAPRLPTVIESEE